MIDVHLSPLHILRWKWVVGGDVIGDLLHEPFEALAAVFFPELLQRADVSVSQSERFGATGIEIVLILVPPNLHHTDIVLHT